MNPFATAAAGAAVGLAVGWVMQGAPLAAPTLLLILTATAAGVWEFVAIYQRHRAWRRRMNEIERRMGWRA